MIRGNNAGNIYVIRQSKVFYLAVGWITAVISLFWLPFIFGAIGVVMGILSAKEGSRAGLALIISSMVLMAAGLLLNGVLFSNLRHILGF